jgi:hypothetical protein
MFLQRTIPNPRRRSRLRISPLAIRVAGPGREAAAVGAEEDLGGVRAVDRAAGLVVEEDLVGAAGLAGRADSAEERVAGTPLRCSMSHAIHWMNWS